MLISHSRTETVDDENSSRPFDLGRNKASAYPSRSLDYGRENRNSCQGEEKLAHFQYSRPNCLIQLSRKSCNCRFSLPKFPPRYRSTVRPCESRLVSFYLLAPFPLAKKDDATACRCSTRLTIGWAKFSFRAFSGPRNSSKIRLSVQQI